VENKVWENDTLIERMLTDKYVERNVWQEMSADQKKATIIGYCADRTDMPAGYVRTYTEEQLSDMVDAFIFKMSGLTYAELAEDYYAELYLRDYESGDDRGSKVDLSTLKILGTYTSTKNGNRDTYYSTFISDTVYNHYNTWYEDVLSKEDNGNQWREEYAEHENGIWAFAIAAVSAEDSAAIQRLVEITYEKTEENYPDLWFELNNAVMYTLSGFNDIIEVLSQVFMWVGLGLAVFSSFLLMNFISTSISYKKQEIGILRAVGARSSDVFKIFFSEAFIIALINFVLAVAASLVGVMLLNDYMREEGINITLLSFGVGQILLMLGISVLVAVLSSFLPVYGIAKKKPVDAIKDR
jgi:hypothetical protein